MVNLARRVGRCGRGGPTDKLTIVLAVVDVMQSNECTIAWLALILVLPHSPQCSDVETRAQMATLPLRPMNEGTWDFIADRPGCTNVDTCHSGGRRAEVRRRRLLAASRSRRSRLGSPHPGPAPATPAKCCPSRFRQGLIVRCALASLSGLLWAMARLKGAAPVTEWGSAGCGRGFSWLSAAPRTVWV